jgi:3-oxoacyl-(acyl-carrier-protein) synthase
MNDRPRIVITGMGAVTPYGVGVDLLWKGLVAGRDAIRPITRFDTADYRVKLGGVVPETDFDFPEDPSLSRLDLGLQFCARAVREAVESAGLTRDDIASADSAIVLSTNFGQAKTFQDVCETSLVDPSLTADAVRPGLLEFAPALLADLWGIRGARAMITLSCASGNAALGYAAELLRRRRADLVIVAGYDVISEFAWSGLLALRTMTSGKITPWDKNRSGTLFGEGAGVVILETQDHADARRAHPRVELAGHHTNNNAFHLTAPDKDGASLVRAMKLALDDARCLPADVDHVNAHGTATPLNDKTETAAIKTVLGKHAYDVPVNAVKSMIGHLCGAASIVETIAAALSCETGIVPPTINFQTPDPDCDLHYCTSGAERHNVRCAVSNSAGLGGCNSVVVLRAYPNNPDSRVASATGVEARRGDAVDAKDSIVEEPQHSRRPDPAATRRDGASRGREVIIELCMANGPTLPLPPGEGRGEGFFESPKNARFLEKSPSPSPSPEGGGNATAGARGPLADAKNNRIGSSGRMA